MAKTHDNARNMVAAMTEDEMEIMLNSAVGGESIRCAAHSLNLMVT